MGNEASSTETIGGGNHDQLALKLESSAESYASSGRSGTNQSLYLMQPTQSYESFQRYLGHLNKLIAQNIPFLKAQFGITWLSISSVLVNNVLLTDAMKKKWFDMKMAQSSVVVQYTRVAGSAIANSEEFIFIRKFSSVQDFMDRVRTLDTVLENIESFSSEAKQIKGHRKGTPDVLAVVTEKDNLLIQEEEVQSLATPGERSPFLRRPEAKHSELNVCCICMERQIERVLTCFHAYCRVCIDDWQERDSSCPLCREQQNGRGSFDLLRGPDGPMREQMKQDLMRELSRIIGELLGEVVILSDSDDGEAEAAKVSPIKQAGIF